VQITGQGKTAREVQEASVADQNPERALSCFTREW
jgi:hypothetical protein